MHRVFVVTGANKGIGYAIVKNIALQVPNATVYLTARDEAQGQMALSTMMQDYGEKLQAEVCFFELDITNRASAERLVAHLLSKHGGLDVLVNNAGFAFKVDSTESPEVQARVTIGVNYEGTKQTSDILIPILRDGGRIVNVCSQMGFLTGRYSDDIIRKLTSPSLSVHDIDNFVKQYITACAEGNRKEKGYPESAYAVSKTAKIALSFVQSKQLKSRRVVVNACCPGYVNTDMSSHKGPLTPDEGADTPVYLAISTDREPSGKFVYKREVLDWVTSK